MTAFIVGPLVLLSFDILHFLRISFIVLEMHIMDSLMRLWLHVCSNLSFGFFWPNVRNWDIFKEVIYKRKIINHYSKRPIDDNCISRMICFRNYINVSLMISQFSKTGNSVGISGTHGCCLKCARSMKYRKMLMNWWYSLETTLLKSPYFLFYGFQNSENSFFVSFFKRFLLLFIENMRLL